MVQLNPINSENGLRNSVNIVCVIDISGSMDESATVVNPNGDKEQLGLSVLDVVKHSVKTIVENLQDEDQLAIVSYSDNARVELKLQKMTP